MFEIYPELTKQESKDDRDYLRGWILRVLVFAVVLVAVAVATRAYAAKAESKDECMLFADYAITARAMVLSEVDLLKRLSVLDQMYIMRDDRMKELATIVRMAADKSDKVAGDFAGLVFQTCLQRDGDLSSLQWPSS